MKKFLNIKNKCGMDLSQTEELFHDLGGFAQKRFGFKKPPTLHLVSDHENASKPLGKTAYYDPQSMAVTIYTDNRHTKDILRSLAHELVHHTQNENGMLNDSGYHGVGYAQKNKDLRQSEKEAYLKGNMCFRDWEDGLKQSKPTIYNEWRINNMSTKKWKNNELMENLSEKFGFKMNLDLLKEGEEPPQLKKHRLKKAGKKEDSGEDEKPDEEGEEESDSEKSSKIPKAKPGEKPDFLDINKDGKKDQSLKAAAADAKAKGIKEDRRDEFEKGDEYDIDKDYGTYPYEHPLAGNVFYQSKLNTVEKHKKFLKDLEEKEGTLHKAVRKPVGGEPSRAIKRMKPLARKFGHVTRKEGAMNESRMMKIIKQEIRKQLKETK